MKDKRMKEIIIYDTEHWTDEGVMSRGWNGIYDNKPLLIQLGAYKIRLDDELTIVDELLLYTIPRNEYGEVLPVTKYFTDLTDIPEEEVLKNGYEFKETMAKFKDFVGDSLIYSYGRDDYCCLNISAYINDMKMPISVKQFKDIRRLLVESDLPIDVVTSHTSGTLYKYFNINSANIHTHDARDDALSILLSLREMLNNKSYSLTLDSFK